MIAFGVPACATPLTRWDGLTLASSFVLHEIRRCEGLGASAKSSTIVCEPRLWMRLLWLAPRPLATYLASIAVTSTSIAIFGHANWLTTRNVEAGIGALPKASARHFSAS